MLHIKVDEKSFNETNILKNIDISLKQGEFISIIGPSGCGKSTLLNIISSLDNDYKGDRITSYNVCYTKLLRYEV